MSILIAYASKHGATAGIAERIGATLHLHGLDACVLPISEVPDVQRYDAAVIGSAVYMGRWMKAATLFVRRHQAQLVRVPLWFFSSGPAGPKPLPEAADLAELRTLLNVKGDATFDGALDAQKLSLSERMMVKAVRAPYGDYREWDRIDEWAGSIATSLGASATQLRVQ
jgi:menaquinone-dependent protoporphyrinogen oxidase